MSELFAFSDDDDLGESMKPLGDVVDTGDSSNSDEDGEEVHARKADAKVKAGKDENSDGASEVVEKEMLMRELRRQRQQLKTLKESIGATNAGSGGSASSSSVQFLRALREARRASSSREDDIGGEEDNDPASRLTGDYKRIYLGLKNQDESIQMLSLDDICCTLATANEYSLAGFSPRIFVPLLLDFVEKKKHNGNMMLTAVRALTHLIDMIPAISVIAVASNAVDILCATLNNIQYVDVAEQSMKCLKLLAEEHPSAVLKGDGIASALKYIDFFSKNTQHQAVTIAAMACRKLQAHRRHFDLRVKGSLATLTNLLQYSDPHIVEGATSCFVRIVNAFKHQESVLKEIVKHGLLPRLTTLISNINDDKLSVRKSGKSVAKGNRYLSSTQNLGIKILTMLSKASPDIGLKLIELNLPDVLSCILMNQSSEKETIRWFMGHKLGPKATENNAPLKKANSFHSTISGDSDQAPDALDGNEAAMKSLVRAKSSPAMSPVHMASSTQLCDLILLIDTLLPTVPREGNSEASPRQRNKAKASRLKALKRKKSVSTASSQVDKDVSGKQKKYKTTKDNSEIEPNDLIDNSINTATAGKAAPVPSTASDATDQTKAHTVDTDLKPMPVQVLGVTARENAHLLLKLAQTMLPSLLFVYNSVTSVSVCTLCLSVLDKILYWIRADDLKLLLEPKVQQSQLSEFFASLLSQSDLQIVLLALKMCLHTLEKAQVFVRNRFLRDGIVTQIRNYGKGFGKNGKLSVTPRGKVDHKQQTMMCPMSPSSRGMSPARAAAYTARYHRVMIEETAITFLNLYCNSKTDIDPDLGGAQSNGNISSIMHRLIEIRKLLETVMAEMMPIGDNDKVSSSSKMVSFDPSTEKPRKSKRAKRARATLSPGSESQVISMESRYTDILRSLRDVLVCDASVSTYELLHSGIIDGLHMFLTKLRSVKTISASVSPANSTDSRASFEYHPQSPAVSLAYQHNSLLSDTCSVEFLRYKDRLCRIQSFLHIFFSPSPIDGPTTVKALPANVLLERLQAAIASCERFPTYLKENLGSSSNQNNRNSRYLGAYRRSNKSFFRGQNEKKVDQGLALLTSPLRIRLMPMPSNSSANSEELANHELQIQSTGDGKVTNAEANIHGIRKKMPPENSEGISVLIEPMASTKSLSEFLVRKLNDEDVDSQGEYDDESDESSNSQDIEGSMKEENEISKMPAKTSLQVASEKNGTFETVGLNENELKSNRTTDIGKKMHRDAEGASSATSTKVASQTKSLHVKPSSSRGNTKMEVKLENLHLYINGYTIYPETTVIEAVSKSGGLGKGFITEEAMFGAKADKNCNGDLRKMQGCVPPNAAVWNSSHIIYYKVQGVKATMDPCKSKIVSRDIPISPRRARPKRKQRPSVTPDQASKFNENDKEDPLLSIRDSQLLGTRTIISQFEAILLETLREEVATSTLLSNGEAKNLDLFSINNDSSTSTTGKEPLPMLMTLAKLVHAISACIDDNGSDSVSRPIPDVMESMNRITHIGFDGVPSGEYLAIEPANFLNSKLASKLLHQTQDSLAVCSRCLPAWCTALTQNYRFFFPFEARRQLFFSSALCAQRSMLYMLNQAESRGQTITKSQKDRLNRLERIKVKVDRSQVLDAAKGLFFKFDIKNISFDVEFEGEVGTGEGPTMEFFTLVAKEFQSKSLELWVDTRKVGDESNYCFAPQGLFPRPFTNSISDDEAARRRNMYEILGKLIGYALLDHKLLPFSFSPVLLKEMRNYQNGEHGPYRNNLGVVKNVETMLLDLSLVDFDLWKQMKKLYDLAEEYKKIVSDSSLTAQQKETMINALGINGAKVEQLCLDFTLPGYDDIDILEDGSSVDVSVANLEKYVEGVCKKMIEETLENVVPPIMKGLSTCIDVSYFSSFSISELDLLIAGKKALFTKAELDNNLLYDHGYASNSKAVVLLREILLEFDQIQQEKFLMFVTGSPRLPCEGLAGLSPRLTVVRKIPTTTEISGSMTEEASLPSASTCTNYFKLPEYKSKEIMREKILKAISYGRSSFHLS